MTPLQYLALGLAYAARAGFADVGLTVCDGVKDANHLFSMPSESVSQRTGQRKVSLSPVRVSVDRGVPGTSGQVCSIGLCRKGKPSDLAASLSLVVLMDMGCRTFMFLGDVCAE